MLRLLYSCLLVGMNLLSWLTLKYTSAAMLGWESIYCVLHDESSHDGSIKTARNGLSVEVKQAWTRRAAFVIFARSYWGTARHELVHR